jgi:hypothetical protein
MERPAWRCVRCEIPINPINLVKDLKSPLKRIDNRKRGFGAGQRLPNLACVARGDHLPILGPFRTAHQFDARSTSGLEGEVIAPRKQGSKIDSGQLTVDYRFTYAPHQPCLLFRTFPQNSPLPPYPPPLCMHAEPSSQFTPCRSFFNEDVRAAVRPRGGERCPAEHGYRNQTSPGIVHGYRRGAAASFTQHARGRRRQGLVGRAARQQPRASRG